MAVNSKEDLTSGTLDGLEIRLKRLEHLIAGQTGTATTKSVPQDETVTRRLEQLEASLSELGSKSPAVREFLELYKTHGELFAASVLPPSDSFSTREQLATVNASATAFSSTASQLTSVQDSPIPSAESSASLVTLQPRLSAVEEKQSVQKRQLSDLRLRSANLLERWYDITVMGGNECWAEWDQKLTKSERALRQEEARRERAKEPI